MLPKMSILLILSTSVLAFTAKADSFFCSPHDQYVSEGINCCLSEIDKHTCDELIRNTISFKTRLKVQQTHRWIMSGQVQSGQYPNCHWNSLSETGIINTISEDSTIFEQMPQLLESQFTEIQRSEARRGDIVVLWFETEVREFDDTTNRKVWVPIGSVAAHSAYLIDQQHIFQKESSVTPDFSVQKIEDMERAYDKGYNDQPGMKKGILKTKFYRKNKQLN